ncbi:caspase family protein [Streptomyces phaeochromogenes]|uniref:Caspase family protein n=1 Tax=Streptomyces phaeochromogenes TaxID=1923 RepID=A0ABZ1HBX3_STRPH|nr:caspase family protein [Streptomyces phaeochromogenes]WSD16093.1 caspase family protein [Streptomyces phaeochromogenes]
MRLPDSKKSRIVLIGSARYESPDLQDVPAIENNLMELRRVSTSDSTGIISPENCTALINPKDQPTVGKLVTEAAEQAEDLLLIYYAGHGLLSLNRHELFLATGGTIAGSKLPFTGVDYSHIRDACLESRARTRVVILDCCYSGRAIPDTLSTTDQDSAFLGQVQVAGTYVMTASPGHAVAKAHPGARYTAFTGELLRILNEGIADGDELLTLNAIYKQLYGSLRASGNPIPRQQTTENSDVMALARNYAHNRLEAPPKPSPPMVTPRPSPMESPTPLSSTSFIPDEVIQIPSVPRTLADREALIGSRPPKWDYLLYASSLHLGMESLNGKWSQYSAGRSSRSRRMSVAQLCHYVDASLEKLQQITHRVGECLTQELQDRAFERPAGKEDPQLVMRMASNLVGVYEDYMDWAMASRGIIAPHKTARLIEMTALIADPPIRQVKAFMEQYISEMDALNDRYATSEIASVGIDLTLEIELDKKVLDDFLTERTNLS